MTPKDKARKAGQEAAKRMKKFRVNVRESWARGEWQVLVFEHPELAPHRDTYFSEALSK